MAAKTAGDLCERFLAWQCRIRQIAMRADGGRPSPGMRPRVLAPSGEEIAPALTVLVIPRDAAESAAFFRFQVQKSGDPRDVYEHGLAYLSADYFQEPARFDDRLAAVFPEASTVSARLAAAGAAVLEFDQWRQRFRLPCRVTLEGEGAFREAALWHNRIFNPMLPDSVRVLAFEPDWPAATADP
jgi:hypothetical protein